MTAAGIREQARYLNRQHEGLGDEFLDAVDAAILRIQETPFISPLIQPYEHQGREIRARRVGRIQTRIVFVVDTTIYVVAAKHAKRMPGYWRKRLS